MPDIVVFSPLYESRYFSGTDTKTPDYKQQNASIDRRHGKRTECNLHEHWHWTVEMVTGHRKNFESNYIFRSCYNVYINFIFIKRIIFVLERLPLFERIFFIKNKIKWCGIRFLSIKPSNMKGYAPPFTELLGRVALNGRRMSPAFSSNIFGRA